MIFDPFFQIQNVQVDPPPHPDHRQASIPNKLSNRANRPSKIVGSLIYCQEPWLYGFSDLHRRFTNPMFLGKYCKSIVFLCLCARIVPEIKAFCFLNSYNEASTDPLILPSRTLGGGGRRIVDLFLNSKFLYETPPRG